MPYENDGGNTKAIVLLFFVSYASAEWYEYECRVAFPSITKCGWYIFKSVRFDRSVTGQPSVGDSRAR